MNKKSLIVLMMLLFINFLLAPKEVLAENEAAIKVWLITDLHYLSPNLTDYGKRFEIFQRQAAGIDYQYGPERLGALLAQIEKEAPDYLIISGDLTSNGEYDSMVELASFFEQVEAVGTQVLVIPGNHDIHNGWAVRFEGKKTIKVKQTSPEDFVTLFGPFGYDEATTRDPNSLSYLAAISDKWNLLMLDTNIYSETPGKGQSEGKGQLKPETLTWINQVLSAAQTQNQFSLPVLHHPGISHFTLLRTGNPVEAASEFQQLLVHYQIPLMASGHLHTQHIAQAQVDDYTLNEVVTSSFSIYPGIIGEFMLQEDKVDYQQIELDMAAWFADKGTGHLTYEDYMAHLETLHRNSTYIIVFDALYNNEKLKEHTKEISEVFELLNISFFKGHIQKDWEMLEPKLRAIEPLLEETDYRFFNGYLDLMLSTKDWSQTELTVNWLNPSP